MKDEKITAWITTYALTQGIFKVHGTVCGDTVLEYRSGMTTYAYGKDWHRTREAAMARAEEMRVKRIASLQKKLNELEKLKFEAEP